MSTPIPYAAALFDMDGLLIDSERAIMAAWMRAAQSLGVALSETRYAEVIGRTAAESDEILARVFGGLRALRAAQAEVDGILSAQSLPERFPLKRGAGRLLQHLAARSIPCAVASSTAREEIEARLSAVGVLHYFSAVAGGDEVAAGKPDPSLYVLAASRAGVEPLRCIAFEDSHNGARSALAAGAALVMVPDLLPPGAELVDRSLCVLRSLDEAVDRVDTWFRRSSRDSTNREGVRQPPD